MTSLICLPSEDPHAVRECQELNPDLPLCSPARYLSTTMAGKLHEFEFEFIGVLRRVQRYFNHICDSTDVQADWRKSCTYGRAPNAIDISQGSLRCPSYTDTGQPFLYGDSDKPPQIVAFYNTLGIRRTYSRLKPPASSRRRLHKNPNCVLRILIENMYSIHV